MNGDDDVLARYESELAPEHAMRALAIKLSGCRCRQTSPMPWSTCISP